MAPATTEQSAGLVRPETNTVVTLGGAAMFVFGYKFSAL